MARQEEGRGQPHVAVWKGHKEVLQEEDVTTTITIGAGKAAPQRGYVTIKFVVHTILIGRLSSPGESSSCLTIPARASADDTYVFFGTTRGFLLLQCRFPTVTRRGGFRPRLSAAAPSSLICRTKLGAVRETYLLVSSPSTT